MNETLWYYVDRAQQRVGPVTAADVAAAWRAGEATDESLVWHEGLVEWAPLSGFRAQLGLDGGVAPEPEPAPAIAAASPLPAPAPGPASVVAAGPKPPKSGSGCLVVGLLIGGLLLLGVAAFVVALALPAYKDYQERVEESSGDVPAVDDTDDGFATGDAPDASDGGVGPADVGEVDLHAAVDEARAHQVAVDAFVANTDRCPRDASEIGLPAPSTPGVAVVRVGEALSRMCTIEIELGGAGAGDLAGETIVLSRDSGGDWYCTSDLAGRASLPADCL